MGHQAAGAKPGTKPRREWVYGAVGRAVKLLFRALKVELDVAGLEHLPAEGGAILAMNHTGYLDFMFAGIAAKPKGRWVRFMAKTEIFAHPVAGRLMRGMNHIEVDRAAGAASYDAALQHLRAGEVVGVFPEGTSSLAYDLLSFRPGAVKLAAAAGVAVIPCIVWGSHRVMTKNRAFEWRRGHPVTVVMGEPLYPSPGDDPLAVTGELQARMHALLAVAMERYRGKPRHGADTWWIPARVGGTAPSVQEAEEAQRIATERRRLAKRGDSPSPPCG